MKRSLLGSLSMAGLVCMAALLPTVPNTNITQRSLVVGRTPSLPSPQDSRQLMFQVMVVPVMRELSEIDEYLRKSSPKPFDEPLSSDLRFLCIILIRHYRYDREPVHKPPWV